MEHGQSEVCIIIGTKARRGTHYCSVYSLRLHSSCSYVLELPQDRSSITSDVVRGQPNQDSKQSHESRVRKSQEVRTSERRPFFTSMRGTEET